MSLDPQAKQLLDALAGMALPNLDDTDPVELRAMMSLPAGAKAAPVAAMDDVLVPGPYREIPVRFYKPEGEGPFPLLVFFHGGGFVVGDLNSYDPLCRTLCHETGMMVVSVDYGLAPEAKFPQGPEECYSATQWLVDNAQSLNIDPGHVAVAGDSAGGCLATVVCQMSQQRSGPSIAHQVLVYPVTDFNFDTDSYRENGDGYFLTQAMMRWFWGHYLNTESDGANPMASPLRAENLSGLPKTTIITAGFDPLRDEGVEYNDQLQAAGVETEHRHYDGMFHGFLSFAEAIDTAAEATDYISQRLKSVLAET